MDSKSIGVGKPNRLYVLLPGDSFLENCLSHGKNSVYQWDRKLSGSNNKISNKQRNNIEGDRTRTAYGRYQNVFLSADEVEELAANVPDYRQYIERLSEHMASTGKRYQNHAAMIMLWARQDKEKTQPKKTYNHEMYTFEEGESL